MRSPPVEAQAVLAFWFDPAQQSHWFDASPQFDAIIRDRFGGTYRLAAQGKLEQWIDTPQGWLALLIVLDQFSRNLHRDDPRAWAQDLRAQRPTLRALKEGYDRPLPPMQRVFAYMPLEHAEDMRLQRHCVALFEALCEQLSTEERHRYTGFLDYARRHQAVIARFGRFPHRNARLGRPCTPEELQYLAEPGAGF